MTESLEARVAAAPHALVIPKWWPNERDPQLGDFIRKQVQALARYEQVTVLLIETSTGHGPSICIDEVDGLTQVRSCYRASASRIKAWRKLMNLLHYRQAAMAGWRLVLSDRGMPSLTHVHILVRPALVAWWLKRRYGIPYVLSEQSSEYLDGTYARKGFLFHALNRLLFRNAAHVTAVSSWLGNGLVKLGLCANYEVVPNVIPGLDRTLPERGDADHFLVVADLVDRTKNVSGVIRAVSQLHKREVVVQLDIIGDGPDRALLEDLVAELGVNDQVTFLGRLPNTGVLDHMANVGSVIVNSNVETFSVVTGEALAQGKPVIATRCGGPEAFVRPGNGLLIPVGDTGALADAMEALVRDHASYDPHRIREGLSSIFGPDAVGKAFLRIHERSLEAVR
ncbi:MAG: glycosyltransferase [Flavobacteriales bacterium]|nr:glycosyltransferase [Flavobacteriales bacterium]